MAKQASEAKTTDEPAPDPTLLAAVMKLARKLAEHEARVANLEIMIGMKDHALGSVKFIGPFSPGAFEQVKDITFGQLTDGSED